MEAVARGPPAPQLSMEEEGADEDEDGSLAALHSIGRERERGYMSVCRNEGGFSSEWA